MPERQLWRAIFGQLEREYWKAYFQKPSPMEQRMITSKAFKSLGLTCKAFYEVFPLRVGYVAYFYKYNPDLYR